MVTWRSLAIWLALLAVCVALGVGIGSVLNWYKNTSISTTTIPGESLNNTSTPSETDPTVPSSRFYQPDKPLGIVLAWDGTIVQKNGDNILFKLNEEEQLWISLRGGYRVFNRRGGKVVDMTLAEVEVGARGNVKAIGLSDLTENVVYADVLEIY